MPPSSRSPSLAAIWRELGIPADYAQRRHLPRQREARKLRLVGRAADGRTVRLAPRAAAAWRRLQTSARADGFELVAVSGFRSVARQALIIRRKLATGMALPAVLRFVAAPGCSEHHTGRALDVATTRAPALDARFGRTAEFRWLRKHAGRFGYFLSYPKGNRHGIGYEPWHWCWRSPRVAN